MSIRLSTGLGQSDSRDRIVSLIDKVPLVSREEANDFLSDVETVVGDAAEARIRPWLLGSLALGGVALFAAIRARRAK